MNDVSNEFVFVLGNVICFLLMILRLCLNLNNVPSKKQRAVNNEVDEVDLDQTFIWHCIIDGLDYFANPIDTVKYEKSIEANHGRERYRQDQLVSGEYHSTSHSSCNRHKYTRYYCLLCDTVDFRLLSLDYIINF